jgi:hypothetical protein
MDMNGYHASIRFTAVSLAHSGLESSHASINIFQCNFEYSFIINLSTKSGRKNHLHFKPEMPAQGSGRSSMFSKSSQVVKMKRVIPAHFSAAPDFPLLLSSNAIL